MTNQTTDEDVLQFLEAELADSLALIPKLEAEVMRHQATLRREIKRIEIYRQLRELESQNGQ